MSLRWRIALAFALVAALVSGTIGVVVYELSGQDLLSRGRARAVAQVKTAAHYYALTEPLISAPALQPNDPSIPATLRAAVKTGHLATYRGSWRGQAVIWAGRPSPDGRTPIFVRESFVSEEQALSDLRDKLLLAAIAATIGGALVGVVLAGRLSLRLRRAAATAEQVAAGDLDARVNAPGHDEVAALGAAIDRMADALQARIEREQRFVADVAHDLRTPLTGLKAAASLLEPDQVGNAVRERVDRLQILVEDLLEIARLESGSATADLRWVDLGKFVEQVVARPGVSVEAVDNTEGLVDPRRLERVLENLVGNGLSHGAPPVEVTVVPGRITVRDHGPGFSEDMLVRATERFARSAAVRGGGFGLGLAIASAQSQLLGGHLELANAESGGAVATVVLRQE